MTDPLPASACPDCGASLPPESPQSLCPACLMRQALASRTLARDGDKAPHLPPPSPEEIADRFPGYEILECLGRGGMGAVYKARQKSLNRLVAIKILAPERVGEGRFAKRFTIEAELLAKLGHPHIVTIHDFGETGGLFYLVMEFIDGVNLRDLLRDGKLESQQALAIVPPICDALQYAHDKGIVHRDIKPENILLDRDGRVKIADFGIASLVGASGENSGTPPYMAPEQSGGTVDRRADIYALGIVLYEMLTGERPAKELVAPSRKVEVDVKIDEMVLRALEKEPERRYQTAGEFRTVVETMTHPERSSGSEVTASSKPSISVWPIAAAAYLVTNSLWAVTGVADVTGNGRLEDRLFPWFLVSWLIACALWAVLHHDCWKALPEKHRATTPGKAVGFLFIPIFNLYWAFVSFPKLAEGVNAWELERGRNPDPGLKVLGVLYAINFVLYWTIAWNPLVGLFVCVFDLAIFFLFYPRGVRRMTTEPLQSSESDVRPVSVPLANLALGLSVLGALIPVAFVWATLPAGIQPGDFEQNFIRGWIVSGVTLSVLVAASGFGWSTRRLARGKAALIAASLSLLIAVASLIVITDSEHEPSLASGSPSASVETLERENRFGATRLEWQVKPDRATCFTAGWYAVEGDRLVDYQDLGNPVEPSAAPFKLVLEHHKQNDQLKLSIGYGGGTGVSGTREAPGSNFQSGSMTNPTTLVADRYTELWRGECFDQDSEGRRTVLRTYVFVARLLGPDEDSKVSQFGEDVESGRLQDELGLNPPAEAKRQRFVPLAGMEDKSSWTLLPEGSALHPSGWAAMAQLTLGGKARFTHPGDEEPFLEIELLKGDTDWLQLAIQDLAPGNEMKDLKITVRRGEPASILVDGVGYKVLFPNQQVALDQPDTTAFATVMILEATEGELSAEGFTQDLLRGWVERRWKTEYPNETFEALEWGEPQSVAPHDWVTIRCKYRYISPRAGNNEAKHVIEERYHTFTKSGDFVRSDMVEEGAIMVEETEAIDDAPIALLKIKQPDGSEEMGRLQPEGIDLLQEVLSREPDHVRPADRGAPLVPPILLELEGNKYAVQPDKIVLIGARDWTMWLSPGIDEKMIEHSDVRVIKGAIQGATVVGHKTGFGTLAGAIGFPLLAALAFLIHRRLNRDRRLEITALFLCVAGVILPLLILIGHLFGIEQAVVALVAYVLFAVMQLAALILGMIRFSEPLGRAAAIASGVMLLGSILFLS